MSIAVALLIIASLSPVGRGKKQLNGGKTEFKFSCWGSGSKTTLDFEIIFVLGDLTLYFFEVKSQCLCLL